VYKIENVGSGTGKKGEKQKYLKKKQKHAKTQKTQGSL
jgi:hypothetical protein